jgi:hypothetical protein
MAILYVLRRPRFPVIVFAEERAFRALSSQELEKLLRRELKADVNVRLLDFEWSWFKSFEKEALAVAPLISSSKPITKETLIDMVNGRANRARATCDTNAARYRAAAAKKSFRSPWRSCQQVSECSCRHGWR